MRAEFIRPFDVSAGLHAEAPGPGKAPRRLPSYRDRAMSSVHTVVIGAGQSGLAMSHCLTDAGVEHVVLERGQTAERWNRERWDSLRLLTPNWASRLPGWEYRGPDPDGFMTAAELTAYLRAYADSFAAPVQRDTDVVSVTGAAGGFVVRTTQTTWRARNIVVATGWSDQPHVPALAAGLPRGITQVTPVSYRNPAQLPDGGVLIVGAGATGVQLADELAAAGRDVVLAAGQHSRVPRRYRGMDIWWWMDRVGVLAATIDDVSDPRQARHEGSLQLVGRDDRRDVDLPALHAAGVQVVGRVAAVDGSRLRLAADLVATTAAADDRLGRLLDQVDGYITAQGLDAEVLPVARPGRLRVTEPPAQLDLSDRGIATVVWATGYRRPYPWLRVPVLDRHGEIAQRRGVTPVEGVYVLGQRFQYRRDSNFIDGVRHDASYLARCISLRRAGRQPAAC
jgi:putative flavoprotein involved in K+ transport